MMKSKALRFASTACSLGVQGRGSHEPVASNASDSGRAQNRRGEIFLAEQSA